MGGIEIIGWVASLATIAAYTVNTMMPLRILAIVSSLCFAVYAILIQSWPLLGMELVLLPINCFRLWQILSLQKRLAQAEEAGEDDFSVIKAYGKARNIATGTLIFERGDPAGQLYYIDTGQVVIEDIGVTVSAGNIFGEIAFFTDAARRTATARCTEDARVYEIDKKRFMRLQFEDPSFGLSVMRTITRRLITNNKLSESNPQLPPNEAQNQELAV